MWENTEAIHKAMQANIKGKNPGLVEKQVIIKE